MRKRCGTNCIFLVLHTSTMRFTRIFWCHNVQILYPLPSNTLKNSCTDVNKPIFMKKKDVIILSNPIKYELNNDEKIKR